MGVVLALSVPSLLLACGESTAPTPSGGEIFEGDWAASVHGSPMTLRIGEFAATGGSEGTLLWAMYDWRLSCSYSEFQDPVLRCWLPGDGPDGCVPDGAVLPYVDIVAADPAAIEAVVGGELHTQAEPCVQDPIMSWEPAAQVRFEPR